MKTYLETRLQFVGCSVDSARIGTLLGLDVTNQVKVTAAGRLVEVQLSEPNGDEESVMKGFEAWVSGHCEGLSAITANKRDLVLKRYVPQNHGWSFLLVPSTVCRLAGELGFGVCVVYVTLWTEKTASKAYATSEPAPGADSSSHQG